MIEADEEAESVSAAGHLPWTLPTSDFSFRPCYIPHTERRGSKRLRSTDRSAAARALAASAFSIVLLSGCEPPPSSESVGDPVGSALDYEALADHVLQRLALERGERVLLVAMPGRFDTMVSRFREGVTAAGAVDLGAWSVTGETSDGWATEFTARLVDATGDDLVEVLAGVDAAVMMPGATVTHPVYAGMQEILRRQQGRTVHFHWAGAYSLDGSLLDQTREFDAFYQRALFATDYAALASAQRGFEQAMRGAVVRVTTPAGTDISFRIGERPVTKQDGDASAARTARARNLIDREIELPAGAARVAPVEESVSGAIAFPPSVWGETTVEGLVLTFEAGRVVGERATGGLEAAVSEMDAAGVAGRSFREFALGLNPVLAIPESGDPWIPYYGYGAGVVRLSLGDNSELGGAVGGGYVRWNFFTDATVTVDDEVWVQDGRLVRGP
jgi:hypothetical protein